MIRRTAMIAANAMVVSAVTWYMFGDRFVVFGVLHFITVASILGLVFLRFYRLNLFFGVGLVVLGYFENSFFDQSIWNWVGLMTFKPLTEDYVPLIPWFGVVLLGLFTTRWMSSIDMLSRQNEPAWVSRSNYLSVAGRHSLLIYMLHQPLLMGVLGLLATLEHRGGSVELGNLLNGLLS